MRARWSRVSGERRGSRSVAQVCGQMVVVLTEDASERPRWTHQRRAEDGTRRSGVGDHYIPQRYLHNFQDPGSPVMIWLHDKREGTAKLLAIKHVAQAKEY